MPTPGLQQAGLFLPSLRALRRPSEETSTSWKVTHIRELVPEEGSTEQMQVPEEELKVSCLPKPGTRLQEEGGVQNPHPK